MKTLGEYYREQVLSLPESEFVTRELPSNYGETIIKRDLFGWKLYSGKTFIECRSEEEARYLKVFLDAGVSEISIPENDGYLKKILPELEKIKMKIDEIVDEYLESVLSRKIRAQVRHAVYMELTK